MREYARYVHFNAQIIIQTIEDLHMYSEIVFVNEVIALLM